MNEKKELPINIISELEQLEGALINLAPILASFYHALKAEGIPESLAEQLACEYFRSVFLNAGKINNEY